MNKKINKIAAGVVLTTMLVSGATPVFAAQNNECIDLETTPIYEPFSESIEETQSGIPKTVLRAVKKIVVDYWDSLPLPDKADVVRGALLDALDFYFDWSDDVETAITSAIYDVFPNANSTVVYVAVTIIMELLPF